MLAESNRWLIFLVGTVAAFFTSALIFTIVRMLSNPAEAFPVALVVAIGAAFAVGCGLTIKHLPLVAWPLSTLAIPAAYLVCARLLLADARDGWGALAYIFGTSYVAIAGTLGVVLGLVISRKRHDA